MTWRRLGWALAYPLAVVGNRLFGWSYEWRNRGIGAWSKETFDPLTRWEWYGEVPKGVPSRVILCGIGYELHVKLMKSLVDGDRLVRFSFREESFGGRIALERRHGEIWQLALHPGSHRISFSACHVTAALGWATMLAGGDHDPVPEDIDEAEESFFRPLPSLMRPCS